MKVYGITETSEHVLLRELDHWSHSRNLQEAQTITAAHKADYHYLYAYTNKVEHKRKGNKERLYYKDCLGNPIRIGDHVCVGTGKHRGVTVQEVVDGYLFEIRLKNEYGTTINPNLVLKVPDSYLK